MTKSQGGVTGTAHTPVGAELSFSIAVPVRQSPATDGAGTGDRVPGHIIPSDSEGRNAHFHMLFLDGVYTTTPWGKSRFHRTNAPDRQELTELVHTISHRVAGFLERDEENSYLNLEEGDEDPMQQVLGCSVGYRIAIEPQQGRKVFTLQTIPAWEDDDRFAQVAKESGLVCLKCWSK